MSGSASASHDDLSRTAKESEFIAQHLSGVSCRLPSAILLSHRGVIQAWSNDAFEGKVDRGEEPADAVADLGNLCGEVVVESAEHRQFRNLLVREDATQASGRRPRGRRWQPPDDPWRTSRVGKVALTGGRVRFAAP